MSNTAISYLYRDGDNYKVNNRTVISGELTKQQESIIRKCLDEEEYFIPYLVRLPAKQFERWDAQADHPYFALGDFEKTEEEPLTDVTPEELVRSFLRWRNHWQQGEHMVPKPCNGETIAPTTGEYRTVSPKTTVGTAALVENIQNLIGAAQNNDWDMVQCVIECLCEDIASGTDAAGLSFTPTPGCLIVPSCVSGLVVRKDGKEFQCANGRPLSECFSYYCADDECERCEFYGEECRPKVSEILLKAGVTVDYSEFSMRDEEILDALEKTAQDAF